MSAPHMILAYLPSLCQEKNYQSLWKFDEVLTKTILTGFV